MTTEKEFVLIRAERQAAFTVVDMSVAARRKAKAQAVARERAVPGKVSTDPGGALHMERPETDDQFSRAANAYPSCDEGITIVEYWENGGVVHDYETYDSPEESIPALAEWVESEANSGSVIEGEIDRMAGWPDDPIGPNAKGLIYLTHHNEFETRWNFGDMGAATRVDTLLESAAGLRLTYERLIAND